jgi:hypothetical protein
MPKRWNGLAVVMLLLGGSGLSSAQTCGDPDGSGAITVTDGVQALRAAAELDSSCSPATCDVNTSGAITVTDGILILRLAAGLSAEGACTTTPTSESARQAINNNPYRGIFGDLTKGNDGNSVRRGRPIEPVALSDAAGVVGSAAQVGDGANCPVDGFQLLAGCQTISTPNGTARVSTIRFEQCTSTTATGFIRQDGIIRETVAGADECILFTQSDLPIGQEIFEERQAFTSEFFDGSGALTDRQTERIQQNITYLDVCDGPLDAKFPSNRRRNLNGEVEIATFGEGEPTVLFTRSFEDVAFTRLYSPSCASHVTTFEEGTLATLDQRFGETYTASFSDLQYTLTSQASGSSLLLTLEGSLASSCGGDSHTFSYQTLSAPTFDPDGDGCPRSGTFEISSDDTLLGRLDFSDTGAVTITEPDSTPITFASCNDPALLLNCAP